MKWVNKVSVGLHTVLKWFMIFVSVLAAFTGNNSLSIDEIDAAANRDREKWKMKAELKEAKRKKAAGERDGD